MEKKKIPGQLGFTWQ